jgi:pimeloyl-ACP methyl ester carboxylesterase
MPDGQAITVRTDDGAELAATIAGPVDGPTVVLSHCWTGSRAIWATVARRLVLTGHRVVLYDQRGHGLSTYGSGLKSISRLGTDLATVIDATGSNDAVVAGHSMGGMSIQALVIEQPEVARDLTGIALVATSACVLGRAVPGAAVDRVLGERLAWSRRGRQGAIAVRRAALGRRPHPIHVSLTLDHFAATDARVRADCMTAIFRMDWRPHLEAVKTPTMVLVGARDLMTPPRMARTLARIPGAELLVIPGAGHMLPLEQPDRVVDAIQRLETKR